MAKYMKEKKHRWWPFFLGMVIYAIVFLAAAGYGLKWFWSYMEAYENSRPANMVTAYMEALTEDHICDLAADTIAQIDHNLQSEEECRAYIKQQIAGGVTHAKKSSECTDTRQVYVLRCGTQVIGQFAITAQAADEYGFTPWVLAEESVDFSYLIGTTVSMTAPMDYIVSVNGHALDSSYITEDRILYEEIEEYYEDYDLPYRVTYTAGPFLGQLEISAADPQGNPAVLDENTDLTQFFHNCTAQEAEDLDTFTEEFVERYVDFTGSTKDNRGGNYQRLLEYVVPGSDLASRLKNALDGLQFGQSKNDKVVSLVTHHQVRLEEGRYMCDVTYEVDTTGNEGVVRTSTSVRLIIVETNDGLRVESISFY